MESEKNQIDDSDFSQSDDESSTNVSSTGKDESSGAKKAETLAGDETKAVLRLRLVIVFLLLPAAIAVTVAIFFVTKNAENQEFEAQFRADALKILDTFEEIVAQVRWIEGVDVGAVWSLYVLASLSRTREPDSLTRSFLSLSKIIQL